MKRDAKVGGGIKEMRPLLLPYSALGRLLTMLKTIPSFGIDVVFKFTPREQTRGKSIISLVSVLS
jgi:hypothetical protein